MNGRQRETETENLIILHKMIFWIVKIGHWFFFIPSFLVAGDGLATWQGVIEEKRSTGRPGKGQDSEDRVSAILQVWRAEVHPDMKRTVVVACACNPRHIGRDRKVPEIFWQVLLYSASPRLGREIVWKQIEEMGDTWKMATKDFFWPPQVHMFSDIFFVF